jgi:regulator of sigma E protease
MQLLGDGSNILLIVLGFGLLIAVHELGHFLAARWAGIRVDAFAIGMGPTIVGWRRGLGLRMGGTASEMERRFGCPPESVSMQRLNAAGVGETEYGLRLLPLGGFVRMKGQEDLHPVGEAGDPDAYPSRPVWKRMVVVSAGVVMNLLLAIALYVLAFMVGVRFESATVGQVDPKGPAAVARSLDGGSDGLRSGDRITRIDGAPVTTFADVQIAVAMSRPGRDVTIELERPGSSAPLRFEATPRDDAQARLRSISITPAHEPVLATEAFADPMMRALLTRSGLADAGIGAGWRLSSVGGADVTSADALVAALSAADGAEVRTDWTGPTEERRSLVMQPMPTLALTAPADQPDQAEFSLFGLCPLTRIDWVRPGSLNEELLRPGDVVLAAADVRGPRLSQFRDLVSARPSSRIDLEVLRDGVVVPVQGRVDASGRLDVLIAPALDLPLLARSIDRASGDAGAVTTPAATLEFAPLTRLERVDDVDVSDWRTLVLALRGAAHDAVRLSARPWGRSDPIATTLKVDAGVRESLASVRWTMPVPIEAFDPLMVTLGAPGRPIEAASLGFEETAKLATLTWLTLDRLARGSVPVDQLRGPVGIVHVGTRVADRGFTYLAFFLAMISVNLAVLNFLPLPIVDGGLFLYLVYEALRGRPPSVRFQNAATVAGLLLIGSLFMVTFYNDVMRLVAG